MDCPSEENMIRLKLDAVEGIGKLEFDLASRRLFVFHSNHETEITSLLEELDLGSEHVGAAGF